MNNSFRSTQLVFVVLSIGLAVVLLYPTVTLIQAKKSISVVAVTFLFRLALFFHLFHIVGYWLYRYMSKMYSAPMINHMPKNPPGVAILVPFRNEPYEIIDRMVHHLAQVTYSNLMILFIDNSTKPDTEKMMFSAEKNGLKVNIVRKIGSQGHKAGALNRAMLQVPDHMKYIIVLDSDHAPKPSIIDELVPLLEDNEDISFVQAPQVYESRSSNIISIAYCYKQSIFYNHIEIAGSFSSKNNVAYSRLRKSFGECFEGKTSPKSHKTQPDRATSETSEVLST